MKFQLSDIETRAEKMREKLNYKKLKESLYDSLKFLSKNLSDNREYVDLAECDRQKRRRFDRRMRREADDVRVANVKD